MQGFGLCGQDPSRAGANRCGPLVNEDQPVQWEPRPPRHRRADRRPGCGVGPRVRPESRAPRSPEPTILEGGGDDFLRRRPRPGPVAGLHHQAVLRELVQVVQGVDLAVPSGVDTDNVELEVAPSAVLAVAYLVASDNAILQMFLGSLNGKEKNTLRNT